jgi:methylthioribose-1-phosphate isomerase
VTGAIAPVRWEHDRLVLLDQRLLPGQELERVYGRWEDVADAIRTLVVRGAPAIGVAAAFGVVLAARSSVASTWDGLMADLEVALKGLASTRPTAVILFWALDRMRRTAEELRGRPLDEARARLLAEAQPSSTRTWPATGRSATTARAWCRPGRASSPTATPGRWRPPATGRRSAWCARPTPRARSPCCGWTRRAR